MECIIEEIYLRYQLIERVDKISDNTMVTKMSVLTVNYDALIDLYNGFGRVQVSYIS